MNQPADTEFTASDLVLVNPAAGGGRARACLAKLKEFAEQRGWKIETVLTASREDLAERAASAAAAGKRRILVLGGDGTFHVLVNALKNSPETILGVIPAGGGNDLAASLGLPRDPLAAAALLLDGEVVPLDLVHVRTSDGSERLYAGGGGVGLDAEAARYASGTYRNLPGRLRYLAAAVRALIGFRATPARIKMTPREPRSLEITPLVVGILNTPSYGGGIYLAPDARTDDAKLDLIVLEAMSFLRVLTLLPRLAATGRMKSRRVHRYSVERIRIETEEPRGFHGDGEILGMTPVEICVLPNAVRVLRAARKDST